MGFLLSLPLISTKMLFKNLLRTLPTIALLCACTDSKHQDVSWGVSIDHQKQIEITGIQLDSLALDSISTSYNGSLHVWKNKLAFVDQTFCWYFLFDTSGRFISRRIGQGESINELSCKKIAAYVPLENGGHMFMGPSWDVYVFDSNFVRKSDFQISWHPRGNKEYITAHPDATDPIMYSILYGIQKIRADHSTVYLPIYSQHPLFFPSTDSYAAEARIFGKLDIKEGDVSELYGRLSPIYGANPNVRTFSYPIYDLLPENKMIVGFPVDSLLYLSDRNFTIQKAFGRMGRDMDTDYVGTTKYNKFGKQWIEENRERGYYTGVDVITEINLVLRTYQKSGKANSDGLQIYKNDTLIADVDIPVKSKYIGYIAPYVYLSAGPDEAKGKIKLYRFKPSI